MKAMRKSIAALCIAALLPSAAAAHPTGPDVKIRELGSTAIGSYSVASKQIGEVAPGSTATFEIYLSGRSEPPKAVRAWVGDESAKGSVKAKAVKTPDYFDADVEVPEPLPERSALWVEVETDAGKEKSSFEIAQ